MMQQPGEKVTVSQAHASPCDWNSIDWKQAIEYVRKLRQEIFRATKEGDLKKVRTLQRIMLRSYENRVVSVRKVSQTNRGKNTPGVDKLVLKTPEARGKMVDWLGQFEPWKPLPARRVYIPKSNGKRRPLGIPVILDRALQMMVKNALEPYWKQGLRIAVTGSDRGDDSTMLCKESSTWPPQRGTGAGSSMQTSRERLTTSATRN